MFSLEVELNGKRVAPGQLSNMIEDMLLTHISEEITNKIGRVRCPEHNQYAKVKAKGRSIDKLSFEISGCCQQLVDQCNKALK